MPTLRRATKHLLYIYGATKAMREMYWVEGKAFTSTFAARREMDRLASTGEWDELSVYDADKQQHLYGWTRDEMRTERVAAD